MKQNSLEELYKRYRMINEGKEIVTGSGNADARIILVGEAPGREEVRLGKPFVGPAGKNLDEFLEVVGLEREELFITNAIKFRLSRINPETGRTVNRPAAKEEILDNRKYLLMEIGIIKPEVVVTLGNVPLRSVTGDMNASIGQMHGTLHTFDHEGEKIRLFPLYHPASVIYNRALRETYINDLLRLKEVISR